MKLPIYIDNHATTPVDPGVIDAMMPYFTDKFGNVASSHCFGLDVKKPVAKARQQVAGLLGADPKEIVFTSGATESNNHAIKGVALANQAEGRHIVTAVTEHKAVLDTCAYLAERGFEVTYLPVDQHGQVSAKQVADAIRDGQKGTKDRTILVSIMGANNEIGTIHPIAEIAEVTRAAGVVFHVDAAQTAGKVPFNVRALGVDLASLSAHKMYGPKGIGALYVRKTEPTFKIESLLHGGGQEFGLRSGTLPVPLVVGFGRACELASEDLAAEMQSLGALRARLASGILGQLEGIRVNGHPTERVPGNLSLTFDDIDGEILALKLKDICYSSTSACSAAVLKPSHVLKAIGLSADQAMSTIRFGIGRFNTVEEIDFVIERTVETVKAMRSRTTKAGRSERPLNV